MRSISKSKGMAWAWIFVLIVLVAINILSAKVHARFDLTAEKRFTISPQAKKLLSNLPQDVSIDVFLSGELPSGFKKLASSVNDLLQEFREINPGKIKFRFVSAEEKIEGSDKTYADTLAALGAQPINLKVQLKAGEQSQYVFPSALIHYNNKVSAVNLYPGTKMLITASELNTAEALMEYNFANAIQKITEDHKPLVGYTVSNGEPVGANTYDLVENILRKDYSLFTFNLNAEPVIPDTFKLLVIVKPTIPFSENEKIKLDQYVMRGGKILWCIERLQAEMDSLRDLNRVVAYDRNLNLEDLLFRYGIRINPDLLLDLQCDFLPFDVNGNGQYEFLHWNYFPLFQSKSNHSINKNIGLVAGRFVNTIDTVKAPGISKTILLSSSPNSKTISAPALISGDENRNAPEDADFKQHDLAVAVLLEGQFNSLYANRMPKALVDSLEIYGTPAQTSTLRSNKMIVISDGDIALNSVVKEQPLPMGVNPYTAETQYQYTFANKDFIQSCINYLVNTSGLNEAKAKDYTVRLLNTKKVEEERTYWQIINIAFPVILVCIFCWVYQYRRRRQYAS